MNINCPGVGECTGKGNTCYDTKEPDWKKGNMNITVGDVQKELETNDFLLSIIKIDFYAWRYFDSLSINSFSKDEFNTSYEAQGCYPSFNCGRTGGDCDANCPNGKTPLYTRLINKRCYESCSASTGCTASKSCCSVQYACFENNSISDDTCTISRVKGQIENKETTKLEGDISNVRYVQGPQWRSRAKNKIGDALCHYVLSEDELDKTDVFSDPFPAYVNNWVADINTTTLLDKSLKAPVLCYVYLYIWSFYFYKAMFRSQYTSMSLNINDNGADLINSVVYSIINPPLTFLQDDITAFASLSLRYPVCERDAGTDDYFLYVYMDFKTFYDIVARKNLNGMNNQLGVSLSHFFQEGDLTLRINGVVKTPDTAKYEILQCFALKTIPGKYEFNSSIYDENEENPFGFNSWLAGDKTNDYDIQANLQVSNVFRDSIQNDMFFMPTFVMRVKITRWHPILIAYFSLNKVLQPTSTLCDQIQSQTGIQVQVCNFCQTFQKTECITLLQTYCGTTFVHTNYTVNNLLFRETINQNSISAQCTCFYSHLPPANQNAFGNAVAMCFNKYCSDSDLDAVNATDSFCKTNCRTVNEWVHPTDPTNASQNPSELNQARFNALCPIAKSNNRVNWNVLGNGLFITLCMTTLTALKRKWYVPFILAIVGIGLSVFLSLDLKPISYCTEPKKDFICRTRYTQLPLPQSSCDYMYCQCFSNEDCPTSCVCGSGLCIPRSYGIDKMQTENRLETRVNVPLLLSLVVFIVCAVIALARYWEIPRARYSVIIPAAIIIIVATVFILRFHSVSIYVGSCVSPVPLLVGYYSEQDNVIQIRDDVERENLVFLTPYSSTFFISNSNMYARNLNPIQIVNKTQGSSIVSIAQTSPFMILSENSSIDLTGFVMLKGKVDMTTGTNDGGITFAAPFNNTPFMFLSWEASDPNSVALVQVQSISSTGFGIFPFFYSSSDKRWKLGGVKSFSWVALSPETNENIPPAFFQEYGSTQLQTLTFKTKYKTQPLVLTTVNTSDSNLIGISNTTEVTTDSFSYAMWTQQTTSTPPDWQKKSSPNLTLQYVVIPMDDK